MQESAFVLLGERREALPSLLQRAFEHPWVASYQIGFGPPLVKSSERVVQRIKLAKNAMEKLHGYFELCVLDDVELERLAVLHRKLVVKQHGPIEAEALDAASAQALDLTLRLFVPRYAPAKARASMEAAGIDFEMADAPPEALTSRFLVRLSNPYGTRLMQEEVVRAQEPALALELRVPSAVADYYRQWLAVLGVPVVELELVPRVRATRSPRP